MVICFDANRLTMTFWMVSLVQSPFLSWDQGMQQGVSRHAAMAGRTTLLLAWTRLLSSRVQLGVKWSVSRQLCTLHIFKPLLAGLMGS